MEAKRRPSLLLPMLLFQVCSANPVANFKNSTSAPATRTRIQIIYVTAPDFSEYSYEDEPPQLTGPPHHSHTHTQQLCDYDPCQHRATPCAQLASSSGCLCPGLSGPFVLPGAPQLKSVTQQDGQVVVEWCAPASTVSHYRVLVPGGKAVTVDDLARRTVLGTLASGTQVCVEAVNPAGSSNPTQESCAQYEPSDVPRTVTLAAGTVGTVLGVLLLLALIVLLRKRRVCFKASSDADGLGNPSYSGDGHV